MAQYTIYRDENGYLRAVVDDAGRVIPPDPENTDYAAYQAWLADGNTPTLGAN